MLWTASQIWRQSTRWQHLNFKLVELYHNDQRVVTLDPRIRSGEANVSPQKRLCTTHHVFPACSATSNLRACEGRKWLSCVHGHIGRKLKCLTSVERKPKAIWDTFEYQKLNSPLLRQKIFVLLRAWAVTKTIRILFERLKTPSIWVLLESLSIAKLFLQPYYIILSQIYTCRPPTRNHYPNSIQDEYCSTQHV